MIRTRRSLDSTRLAALASRPGIDPRVWLSYGRVTDVGFDGERGVFVDLTMLPDGHTDTAYLGAAYAGNEYGAFAPVSVGDLVLVATPQGDANTGPTIVARLWSASAKPPTEVQDPADTETTVLDVVTVVRTGQAYKVITKGSGAILFEATGSGNATMRAPGAMVLLQGGTEPFVRGTNYADNLGFFLDALKVVMAAIGVFATAVGAVVPPAAPAAVTLNTAITTFITAVDAFKAARISYLSSKVAGE